MNQTSPPGIPKASTITWLQSRTPWPQVPISPVLRGSVDLSRMPGYLRKLKFHPLFRTLAFFGLLMAAGASARQAASPPVVVQPGAPGQPSKTLPASTRPTLPQRSAADVAFMQGMIMHHSQAVEMTALIASHTQNKDVRSLGAKISSSQSDEIHFMKRWLVARGQPVYMSMPGMPDMDMSGQPMAPMPGMLTSAQMEALRTARNTEFDHLFLTGMIQHH